MQTQVVTLDVLKPIGTTVDLSDSFNARVGDKMTPFQLFITEGGVAKDLKGMHPELEAIVGNGALKGNKAIMNAGTKGVHWVGSTNNVTGYNQLTLAFPAEVFPQSGFCYGHLILANEAGVRESSVDIWFQVLDGTPQMGMVADHYDSELALELAKAKNMNDQFSQEMRAAYNQQVTDAQNALTKARGDLQDVATAAGNIHAQITAQDIVTRAEFKDGMDDIRKNTYGAISNVTNGAPKPIKDLATLQAKLPNGDTGFYVTSDTGLKYAFVDGTWQSFGVYQATAMPEEDKNNLDDLVKYRNKRNLVANNDWHTGDITNWYTIGNIDTEVQTGAYQGRNVLRIQNHGQSGDSWNGITSEPIPVIAGQPISEAVKA
ncbi:hypothetical protein LMB21_06085, partial [Limosilactobacillus reuteri]|uniref:hypothetical protein n=1 Tax=Limosilactobacillus reuteri TaxID=1598 RepID=UPI001E2C6E90